MRGVSWKRKGALNTQKRDLDGNQSSRNNSAVFLFRDNAHNEQYSAPLTDAEGYHAKHKTVNNLKKSNQVKTKI